MRGNEVSLQTKQPIVCNEDVLQSTKKATCHTDRTGSGVLENHPGSCTVADCLERTDLRWNTVRGDSDL